VTFQVPTRSSRPASILTFVSHRHYLLLHHAVHRARSRASEHAESGTVTYLPLPSHNLLPFPKFAAAPTPGTQDRIRNPSLPSSDIDVPSLSTTQADSLWLLPQDMSADNGNVPPLLFARTCAKAESNLSHTLFTHC